MRTALSLSLSTGMPFRIEKIRAGRKPGLLRQHLTAVLAASEIGEADVGGVALGSMDLTFTPKTVRAGEFHFAVGTAGSGTLVFQTTAFGRLGVAAEKVADEVARQAREYLVSTAAAGEHLADQLLLPMALAGDGSFTATKLSMHARTNLEVISKFLPVQFTVHPGEGHFRVVVNPD